MAEATFAKKGVWRSKIMKGNVNKIEIKYEQPEGTSMKVSIIDPISGLRKPLSFKQAIPIRPNVYSESITDINIRGDWQVELELETTVENLSPVIYEIDFE